jgi:hypothetical protein
MSAFWSILGNWWGGISLRVKLVFSVVASVLSVLGYLFARWRIAQIRADRAGERADTLEATREKELDILRRQKKSREKIEKLREQIAKRKERDFFEEPYK